MRIVLLALILMSTPVLGHTMQIDLEINNTVNTVYIPGFGKGSSGTVAAGTYTAPPHFYVASYNKELIGLVHSQSTPISIGFSRSGGSHFLSLNQNVSNSQAFLVFSRGNYENIQGRIRLVEDGKFMTKISPSFSYNFLEKNPIKMFLNYSNIDIVGSLLLRKGTHQISIESNKTSGSRVVIINRIGG